MKNLPKIHLLAGKDEMRPILQYICVDKKNIAATNAHILGSLKTETVFGKEFVKQLGEDSILIHKDQWKRFIQDDLTYAEFKLFSGYIEISNISYKGKKSPEKHLLTCEKEGTGLRYPNWRTIIPTLEQEISSVGMDLNLLETICKVAKKFNDSGSRTFTFYGRGKGIILTSESCKFESVFMIMPS
jgi:hypothetical protein